MERINISLVAPSGTFSADDLELAIKRAHDLGFNIISTTTKRDGQPAFLNGTLADRLSELEAAELTNADGIWCARGGCGAIEMWQRYSDVNFANSAPLIGYSDITIYHFLRFLRAQRIGIHGPVFLEIAHGDTAHLEALTLLLRGHAERLVYPTLKNINHSVASHITGELLPMNLASLTSLLGCFNSDFLRGKILALEDVNEAPYKVFRMMHHLRNAGCLAGLKALIVGYFGEHRDEIINDTMVPLAQSTGLPLFDWPIFGHERPNWPLLFGANVTIKKIDEPFFTLTYNEQHDHRPIVYENP